MPFSLSELANDSDLGQPILILRTAGSFAAGGWQAGAIQQIPGFGVITIADDEALAQIPEGDRVSGSLQLISAQPIYETQAARAGISDKIQWNGNSYRVQSVGPWRDFGFYAAILARMTGE